MGRPRRGVLTGSEILSGVNSPDERWGDVLRESPLVTAREAAQLLRTSPRTLEGWRARGEGPAWVRLGRRVAYRRDIVLDFVAEQETGGRKATESVKKSKDLELEVTTRPYFKDRTRIHVDMVFPHPHTNEPIRMRRVAPAGLDTLAATEWGRSLGMREFMKLGKAPTSDASEAREEAKEEPAKKEKVQILEEFWDNVFSVRYVATLKHSTRLGFEEVWRNHIKPVLGAYRLDEIDGVLLEKLRTSLEEKGLKVSTQKNFARKATRCLQWAVDRKYVVMDIQTIKFERQKRVRKAVYEKVQWEELVTVEADPADRLLALITTEAILRIGEAAGLQWSDINFTEGFMTIQRNVCKGVLQDSPKGEIGDVPLTPRLAAALQEHKEQHACGPFVLGYIKNGVATFSHDKRLGGRLRAMQKRALLPVWGPHRVRHSILSYLASRGVSPYALQAFARHADMATTMRYYVHLDRLKLAREAISALTMPAQPPRKRRPTRPDAAPATRRTKTPHPDTVPASRRTVRGPRTSSPQPIGNGPATNGNGGEIPPVT